jgi:SOS response regulatory protein OraA/RecX
VPRVTALTAVRDRVAVELDGAPWRTLPVSAVVEVGLTVGEDLDRVRARALGRALRREHARRVALQALTRRDHSRASLAARLERAGVAASDRRDVLTSAARAGLLDDLRFAETRASALAGRGSGDLLVLDDLVRHGIEEAVARDVVSRLEPESRRAARIVAARGRSIRTVRYLAARGFTQDTMDGLVAEFER